MNLIENQRHFGELAKTSNFPPYVLVQRVNDKRQLYIPLHWMHRPACARKATKKDVLQCFYSTCLNTWPQFRRYLVDVNVIKVFEGRVAVSSDDESENSTSNAAQPTSDEKALSVQKRISEAIDLATEKSTQTRINALKQIASVLSTVYMPDLIENHKVTILDIIEKALRRGKGEEQTCAAQIAPMLMFHIDNGEEVVKVMTPLLRQIMLNESSSFETRAKCCSALSLVQFLDENYSSDTWELMQQLETIFKGSYAKDDYSSSTVRADESELHAVALRAWGLLLTLVPTDDFQILFNVGSFKPSIENLLGLLESQHVEMRTTTGEVTALLLESGRAYDTNFLKDHLPDLIEATHRLATGSNKLHAKRDRKIQRATLRDVVQYVESNVMPDIDVKFPDDGCLKLNSWFLYFQYTAISASMGPGIPKHLSENNFMRGVLQLGDKSEFEDTFGKYSARRERRYDNAVNSKMRTLARKHDRQIQYDE